MTSSIEQLPDGSYLTEIFDQRDIHHTRPGLRVRAIEYTLAGHQGVYRLITTILDPGQAPASDLATLYAQRWEFESTWTRSRPTSAGRTWCCARSTPTAPSRSCTAFCWSITRSGA